MKKLILITLLLPIGLAGFAQSIDEALESVKKNNKTIQSGRQYQLSQNTLAKTGNTPQNPVVEYDHLFGSPAGAGTQKDFTITQQFDFPSVYGNRAKLAEAKIEQNSYLQKNAEQEVLLEAKKLLIELVYENKRQDELEKRLVVSQRLFSDTKKRFDLQDATILNYNKIKVQLATAQSDIVLQRGKLAQIRDELTNLNGGVEIRLTDTIYPPIIPVPSFEELDSLIEANDPIVKSFEKNIDVNKQQLGVVRSLTLPKFETGYHSQSILGQSYRGFHLGISIPLWENRNKVKAQSQALDYSSLRMVEHRIEHSFSNRAVYDRHVSIKASLSELQEILGGLNTLPMLTKALSLGQITSIDYANGLISYYSLTDRLLELEKEYHLTVAELYKFRL